MERRERRGAPVLSSFVRSLSSPRTCTIWNSDAHAYTHVDPYTCSSITKESLGRRACTHAERKKLLACMHARIYCSFGRITYANDRRPTAYGFLFLSLSLSPRLYSFAPANGAQDRENRWNWRTPRIIHGNVAFRDPRLVSKRTRNPNF